MAQAVGQDLKAALGELIRRTSTELPEDVCQAISAAREREVSGSAAHGALGTILDNVALSRSSGTPICQDTGTPVFYVRHPVGTSTRAIAEQIREALGEATRLSILRPNSVDSVTGANPNDNSGLYFPTIHFEEFEGLPPSGGRHEPPRRGGDVMGEFDGAGDRLEVRLMLKGGGSENVCAQYSLPDGALDAGRDLKGVEKVALHAVFTAQGQGCAPGAIGIGIGGDRPTSFMIAKEQHFRPFGDRNPDPALAALEDSLLEKMNRLGIGPMGFGGKTTCLAVKCAKGHRLPASFFVSISYMCWACRRRTLVIENGKASIA